MKALKPSHKEDKRYLLLSGKDVNGKNIDEAVLRFVGILGYAKACPQIIRTTKKKLILAINRKELDKIRASFLMSGKDIKIDRVSGMIGKL